MMVFERRGQELILGHGIKYKANIALIKNTHVYYEYISINRKIQKRI